LGSATDVLKSDRDVHAQFDTRRRHCAWYGVHHRRRDAARISFSRRQDRVLDVSGIDPAPRCSSAHLDVAQLREGVSIRTAIADLATIIAGVRGTTTSPFAATRFELVRLEKRGD
jgi:hypothetical protein